MIDETIGGAPPEVATLLSSGAWHDSTGPKTVLICGYFGFDNFGDQVAAGHLTDLLDTSGLLARVNIHPRERGFIGVVKRTLTTYRSAKECDVVLLGPGGLLKPPRSGGAFSLIAVSLAPILLATLAGRPSVCFSVDASGVDGHSSRTVLRWALHLTDEIWVRDTDTETFISNLASGRLLAHARADSLFALAEPQQPTHSHHLACAATVLNRKLRIGVALSVSDVGRNAPPTFGRDVLEAIRVFGEEVGVSCCVEMIGLHGGRDGDLPFMSELFPDIVADAPTTDLSRATWTDALAVIQGFDIVLASRFHAVVLALAGGRPVAAVARSAKVHRLFDRFELGQLVTSPDSGDLVTELASAIHGAFVEREHHADLVARLVARERRLAQLAEVELVEFIRSARPVGRPLGTRLLAAVIYAISVLVHFGQIAIRRCRTWPRPSLCEDG